MKYGQAYRQALASEDFPPNWISAAVSYRDLKKCIKRVQQELLDLGLDTETLGQLQRSFEVAQRALPGSPGGELLRFKPSLWIAADAKTGQFLDAGLTSETKAYFSKQSSPATRSTPFFEEFDQKSPNRNSPSDSSAVVDDAKATGTEIEWRQIPLATATTFFDSLDPKLAQQEELQKVEAQRLEQAIATLGHEIQTLTDPTDSKPLKAKAQQDVIVWRKLFEMYLDSTVFFSSHEQDHGTRSYVKAKSQLQHFSDLLLQQNIVKSFKVPRSRVAFDAFVQINLDILRVMHFQEINAVAVRKILKKFDKRTALGAARVYSSAAVSGPFARSVAKDMCAELSSKVVSVVPQMDDYICPICCELAWRPIRLGCCNSVFCIRCVIKLQRDGEERCPMCRQKTVMTADSGCIDADTAAFLVRYFPREVKERQKANQRAAGVDRYGEKFYRSTCVIM